MYGRVLPATLPVTGAAGAMYIGVTDATQIAVAVAAGLAAWALIYLAYTKFGKR